MHNAYTAVLIPNEEKKDGLTNSYSFCERKKKNFLNFPFSVMLVSVTERIFG